MKNNNKIKTYKKNLVDYKKKKKKKNGDKSNFFQSFELKLSLLLTRLLNYHSYLRGGTD